MRASTVDMEREGTPEGNATCTGFQSQMSFSMKRQILITRITLRKQKRKENKRKRTIIEEKKEKEQ